MSLWRRTALEMMPDLEQVITDAQSVMALWISLNRELERAYETEPVAESVVTGIYRYAVWCRTRSGNADASTAVCVAFYEHLPTHGKARKDLSNRITNEEFDQLKDLFRYLLSDKEYEAFREEFRFRRNALSGRLSRKDQQRR
jgi:hypothetical protein